MLGYGSIEGTYRLNFDLLQHHKYSLNEIENLMPFERDLYVDMLIHHIEQENERLEKLSRK